MRSVLKQTDSAVQYRKNIGKLENICVIFQVEDMHLTLSFSTSLDEKTKAHLSCYSLPVFLGLPESSADKESTYKAEDPNSLPGSGRSAGEGLSSPLQYSWVSLVAQLVTNPPAMRETWVWSLGWEDPLEKGNAPHPSSLACYS